MKHSTRICKRIESALDEILLLRNERVLKKDNSFVSKGDLLIQKIILDYVKRNMSTHKLISEELAPFENTKWKKNGSYLILDPIDGTENFISGLKEWGVGFSIYTEGLHKESCIYLPELNDKAITGMKQPRFQSRILGLSSSLKKKDFEVIPEGFEYRIIGCSMYNMLAAVRGSYRRFENVKGVNCWDILPGLNLAIENNVKAFVDEFQYNGEILFPTKKYKIRIGE